MNPDKLRYMSADPEMYREELRQPAAPSTPAPAQPPLDSLCVGCGKPLWEHYQHYLCWPMTENELEQFEHFDASESRAAAPAPEPEEWLRREIEKRVEVFVRDVAELPDRCSPDDWPEAMLVTDAELAEMIRCELNDFARAYREECTQRSEYEIRGR